MSSIIFGVDYLIMIHSTTHEMCISSDELEIAKVVNYLFFEKFLIIFI